MYAISDVRYNRSDVPARSDSAGEGVTPRGCRKWQEGHDTPMRKPQIKKSKKKKKIRWLQAETRRPWASRGGVAHDAGIGAVLQPDMSNRRNMPSAPPEPTGNAVSDYGNVGDADFQPKEIKRLITIPRKWVCKPACNKLASRESIARLRHRF